MDDASRFGRYTLLGEVGDGQMIEVWIAGEEIEGGTRRTCILKRVAPAYRDLAALKKQIESEAAVVGRLEHPDIVALIDAGEIDGLAYLTLELTDGVALRQLASIGGGARLAPAHIVEVGRRCAKALAFAHGRAAEDGTPMGLVHRKVSPANVLLGRGGEVKLADFGPAPASERDPLVDLALRPDQLRYLAPEQINKGTSDARTDIFSLGAVLAEMLTGEVLFMTSASATEDAPGRITRYCAQTSTEQTDLTELGALLACMTALDADARPASAAEAAESFKQLAGSIGTELSLAGFLETQVFARLPVIDDLEVIDDDPVPVPSDVPARGSLDPKQAMLGAARVPGGRIEALARGPSYPTTGSVLLDDFDAPVEDAGDQGDTAGTDDAAGTDQLPPPVATPAADAVPTQPDLPAFPPPEGPGPLGNVPAYSPPKRLPADALVALNEGAVAAKDPAESPAEPVSNAPPVITGEPINEAPRVVPGQPIEQAPPVVAGQPINEAPATIEGQPETSADPAASPAEAKRCLRLGAHGVKLLLSYGPYQRAIGVARGGLAQAADTHQWEYYFVSGDHVGPRIIRKNLESRFYRDQTVTLLEGSKYVTRSLQEMLTDARSVAPGAFEARGGTGAVELGGDNDDDRYLRVHEARPVPRSRAEPTNLRSRLARFLKGS